MPLNIHIQWNVGTACVSECVLKTLWRVGVCVSALLSLCPCFRNSRFRNSENQKCQLQKFLNQKYLAKLTFGIFCAGRPPQKNQKPRLWKTLPVKHIGHLRFAYRALPGTNLRNARCTTRKSKWGLSKRGLSPKGANWAQKGLSGEFLLPPRGCEVRRNRSQSAPKRPR